MFKRVTKYIPSQVKNKLKTTERTNYLIYNKASCPKHGNPVLYPPSHIPIGLDWTRSECGQSLIEPDWAWLDSE